MKAWFIFNIKELDCLVGVWANSSNEGIKKLFNYLGETEIKFVGIDFFLEFSEKKIEFEKLYI